MPHSLGWYHTATPTGFVLHLSATAANLHATRALIGKTLADAGVAEGQSYAVQLVMSELFGNAVRACGDFVPLVAEVAVEPPQGHRSGAERGVRVRLHDPYRQAMPVRGGVRLDDPEAESGRGLPLIDLLAPGWRVAGTPVGKQVRCRIPAQGEAIV
ncbi:ATP-binding protein [Streptomyces montanisoli]|uniref:ATP-binding protein n=1 Tax=Streptomyces montanisoli TaxID=2798581 RepID=A0A940RZR9_9ACTN|nr:ATP-binding protein [Streptomyces montanisoli]MBP0460538.1 ATP-binding protein [Streptomyces montanisoli]